MPAYPIAYGEGTVIVDVVNPETLDLLWRGTATAVLSFLEPQALSKMR